MIDPVMAVLRRKHFPPPGQPSQLPRPALLGVDPGLANTITQATSTATATGSCASSTHRHTQGNHQTMNTTDSEPRRGWGARRDPASGYGSPANFETDPCSHHETIAATVEVAHPKDGE